MELHGWVRYSVGIDPRHENVVRIVDIEDGEAINAARGLILIVVGLSLVDLDKPLLIRGNLLQSILDTLRDVVIVRGHKVLRVQPYELYKVHLRVVNGLPHSDIVVALYAIEGRPVLELILGLTELPMIWLLREDRDLSCLKGHTDRSHLEDVSSPRKVLVLDASVVLERQVGLVQDRYNITCVSQVTSEHANQDSSGLLASHLALCAGIYHALL